MSALAPDALAGIAIATAPTADEGETAAAAVLVGGLIALGAKLITDGELVDLAFVVVDQRPSPDEPRPIAGPSLDDAADGELATSLTEAFGAARKVFARLRSGGCLLFVLAGASADHVDTDPAGAAIGSLTRTLALEWAPERRVNALICVRPQDAIEAAALIAWPASRTVTGAVLDLVG
jgi:NAD(P)-dependent dehydrogenase (short-subunit alcohol dehydrogenase family)